MSYAAEHRDALADMAREGAAVTFTKDGRTHDAATDTFGSGSTTVSGYAMRVKGDATVYERLSLTPKEAVTLLFVPSTFGETPQLGATVTWSGDKLTVKQVEPLEPDWTAILSHVVCAR